MRGRGAGIWCEGPWGVLCGSDVVVVAVDLEVELGVWAGARCRCWQRVEPAFWRQDGEGREASVGGKLVGEEVPGEEGEKEV